MHGHGFNHVCTAHRIARRCQILEEPRASSRPRSGLSRRVNVRVIKGPNIRSSTRLRCHSRSPPSNRVSMRLITRLSSHAGRRHEDYPAETPQQAPEQSFEQSRYEAPDQT